jgi:hypothetical protein
LPPHPSSTLWPLSFVLALGCAAPEVLPAAHAGEAVVPERERLAPPERHAPEPVQLELIADFNPPRPEPSAPLDAPGPRWDAALGGLSGLYYDRSSSTLYAVSDLPRRFEPRLYTFSVELTDTSLHLEPKSVQFFREREPSGRLEGLDAESIAGDGRGVFYIGTENGFERPKQTVPRILRVQADDLLVTGELTLPEAYLPSPDAPPRGTRSNLAFEGLALSPSKRWLAAMVESSLEQDGEPATFEHGASVRLLLWDLTAPGDPTEYFYPIEPIPRPSTGTPIGGVNGVSELIFVGERRLLVLERAYVPLAEGHGPNTLRIYEVAMPDEPTPPGGPPRQLSKRLVLDLDDIVPKLDPGARLLDNAEGMTIGPDLPSGEASLLLVTDDNFRTEQRTVFLAFRIRGAGVER